MRNKILIAGIDPGTTKAYALFNPRKELVACSSKKEFGMADLISEITAYGRIAAVGTDKKRIPEFVEKLAAKIGARIIAPEYDMELAEKIAAAKEYEARNSHEKDAIAAAIAAHKKLSGTIDKVARFCLVYKKEALQDSILELVLTHNISIRLAAEILEKPDSEFAKESRRVMEQPKLTRNDFIRLMEKLHERERDVRVLKQQVSRLQDEIRARQVKPTRPKPEENILGRRVVLLYRSLDQKTKEIEMVRAKLRNLNALMANLGYGYVLAKKLDSLGHHEFMRKSRLLRIHEGDLLLVANPGIYSEAVLSQLKDAIIIYRKKPAAAVSQKFACIPAESLELKEDMLFAAVQQKQLQERIKSRERLQSIINAYKDERGLLRA